MAYHLSAVILLLGVGLLASCNICSAFVAPRSTFVQSVRNVESASAPSKFQSRLKQSTGNGHKRASTTRPKRTLQDRTSTEAIELIQDVLKSAFEAGPRAAPSRTFQAYIAITRTLQDSLPMPGRPTFSAPTALRKLFERLGATYVKLGQFIASSPSLFPAEYVLEFQKCLDNTEPLEWAVIQPIIEREIGPISKKFASVDKTPLASASIAQVHSAVLKNGDEVVIKVQKPQIEELLKADLNFIYIASRVLQFLQPDFERTSLADVAFDVKSSMLEELDFVQESKNIEEFNQFLQRENLQNSVTAPQVYKDLTTRKVLTMTRLRGVSMVDAESIKGITNDPESVIITAMNTWTTSVMKMDWFHADVHSGNLLVLKDGRVGFIDFGMVGRVGEKTFKAVNELSTSMASSDYEGMALALCNMGATDEQVDIKQFAADIEKTMVNLSSVQDLSMAALSDGTMTGSANDGEDDITKVLLDIVDVTENNGLKLPREFGLLAKQSLYFDRYLKILAPEIDVMNDARVSGIVDSTDVEAVEAELVT